MSCRPDSTNEAVVTDTPARAATSRKVTRSGLVGDTSPRSSVLPARAFDNTLTLTCPCDESHTQLNVLAGARVHGSSLIAGSADMPHHDPVPDATIALAAAGVSVLI